MFVHFLQLRCWPCGVTHFWGSQPWPESWTALNSWNSHWDFTDGELWGCSSTWESVVHFIQKILLMLWLYLLMLPSGISLHSIQALVRTFGGHCLVAGWTFLTSRAVKYPKITDFLKFFFKKPKVPRICVSFLHIFLRFSLRTC